MNRSKPPRSKPLATDLRPLEAKTLKSILDTLQFEIAGRKILELYAGTGRFSEACLNRGAQQSLLVELGAKNARLLKEKLLADGAPIQVICKDVLEFLEIDSGKYDLIFADPPFRIWNQALAEKLIPACAARLSPNGILLVRYPKRVLTSVPESALEEYRVTTWKQKPFGESVLWYLRAEDD